MKKQIFYTLFFTFLWGYGHCQERLFTVVDSKTSGITFTNTITETENMNIFRYDYLYNGGGVGVIDINNDGLMDLYFSGNMVDDKLYLNKGNFVFEDITKSAGIEVSSWSSGVCVWDVNNDGYQDLYICQSGPNLTSARKNKLFINQKNNTFKEEAAGYGLDLNGFFTQAAPIDYDQDGDLDLYVMGHPEPENLKLPVKVLLERISKGEVPSDALMENREGKFINVTRDAGIFEYGFGLGLAITDVNLDRYPDIIVANDFDEPDHIFVNQKNGTFKDEALTRFKHTSNYSMGNDVGDINNDGYMDVITVDMAQINHVRSKTNMESMSPEKFNARLLLGWNYQYMHNMLQLNTGMGSYQEISYMAGVAKTDWSWAPLFFDMDGDGWQDLFISNGYKRDTKNNDIQKKIYDEYNDDNKDVKLVDLLEIIPSENIANYFYRNQHNNTFSDENHNWAPPEALKSNGAAYVDLDNDGDLDLVVNNMDVTASIYKNNSENFGVTRISFEKMKMSDYLGAQLYYSTDKQAQFREAYFVRGYQSTVTQQINFLYPRDQSPKSLVITLSSGKTAYYELHDLDQIIHPIMNDFQNDAPAIRLNTRLKNLTEKYNLAALHQENDYNDFNREVLLPQKQSMQGPGLAVADFNRDGLDDFVLGNSVGYQPQIFLQKANGTFFAYKVPAFILLKGMETVAVEAIDVNRDNFKDLVFVGGSYEKENDDSSYQTGLYIGNGQGIFGWVKNAIPVYKQNTGNIIQADYDDDGDTDLLLLAATVPGQYPLAGENVLLRNDKGFYKNVTNEVISDINLGENGVSRDATFSDYDEDDDLDLLIVNEWGSLRVFENNSNAYHEIKNQVLENGWWQAIYAADIDGDGDEDYLVGNAGVNNKFHPDEKHPLHIFLNDFDSNGSKDIVLAYKSGKELLPVRGRECSSEQVPIISEKFETYESFALADLEEIYGAEKLKKALHYEATNFKSGIIWNNSGALNFEAFPLMAQLSWIRSFVTYDVNSDGLLDILAVGNHFGTEVETTKYDGNTGICLIQNKDHSFEYIPAYESGFYVHEDTRVIKKLKIAEGKEVVIVASNNGYVQVFGH